MSKTLLEALAGEAEREALLSPLEEELARYAASELPPTRERELLRRAETDRSLQPLLEAHRPFGTAERARILEGVKAALAEPRDSSSSAAAEQSSRPQRRARQAWLWSLLPPLVAAAAVMIWFSRSPQPAQLQWAHYSLEASQSSEEFREGPPTQPSRSGWLVDESPRPEATPLMLESGSRLTLLLRPEQATTLNPKVSVFVAPEAGAFEAWPHAVERAPSGALRLTVDQVVELPAAGRLAVILDGEASTARALQILQDTSDRGPNWQRLSLRFELADAPQHR